MLVLIAAAVAIATGEDQGWAKFSADYARPRINIEVSIGTVDPNRRPVSYWFRRTTEIPGQIVRIDETNTIQCPPLMSALYSLQRLPAPRAVIPFLDHDNMWVTADGISYTLTMLAAYPNSGTDEITLKSNTDTPLANWIDRTLKAMQACVLATR